MVISLLAAGAGVATAIFVIPRAHRAVLGASSATVYSEPQEGPASESEAADTAPTAGESSAAPVGEGEHDGQPEPEIPVGEDEEPPVVDPDDALELVPARKSEEFPAKVPANPPLDLAEVEVEMVEGSRPWVLHRLTPFETVDQVAYRHDVTPEALRTWNGLGPDVQILQPGSRVRLKARRIPPPRERIEYVVQPGDTWWSIAVAHVVDSKELRRANWRSKRELIVGDTIAVWVDPAVYHWVQTDRPDLDDEDLLSNIRRGAVGVGPPWSGRLINGVQIPPGPGWKRKMLPSSYGTTHAVVYLVAALQQFHADSGYGRDLLLGSMSRRHGGPLAGHRSHQSGRDLDIRLPLSEEHPPWFPIKPWRVDYEALWKLVSILSETGEVEIIFLDYDLQKTLFKAATKMGIPEDERRRMIQWPRGRGAQRGMVRHSSGHEAHIHVRFRCGPQETECVLGESWKQGRG